MCMCMRVCGATTHIHTRARKPSSVFRIHYTLTTTHLCVYVHVHVYVCVCVCMWALLTRGTGQKLAHCSSKRVCVC
jgi:hypothetical protein